MPSSPLHLEILAWRKSERRRLIDARLAIGAEVRRRYSTEIAEQLSEFIGVLSGRTVSAYWPFRGEPDLRPWIQGLTDLGARFALRSSSKRTYRSSSAFGNMAKDLFLVSGIFPSPPMASRLFPTLSSRR